MVGEGLYGFRNYAKKTVFFCFEKTKKLWLYRIFFLRLLQKIQKKGGWGTKINWLGEGESGFVDPSSYFKKYMK